MKDPLFLLHAPEYAPRLRCSFTLLAWATLALLVLVITLETVFALTVSSGLESEREAEKRMRQGMSVVRQLRASLDIPVDPVLDPNGTGMIGADYTDLTTTQGSLTAKRTSCNPAFAGLLVRWLSQAGVRAGDRVAVNLSGSFPALNIAALAACATLNLEPVIISSVGSSTYGANIPGLTWLDMERALNAESVFSLSSRAVSLGGIIETDGGIDGTGLQLAAEAMSRHGAAVLDEGAFDVVERDALRRKAIFEQEGPVKAFVNIGGALTALGWIPEAARLGNGLLRSMPVSSAPARGLLFRYWEEGVPVIHMLNIERLATRHALPIDPIPMQERSAVDEKKHRLWRVLFGALVMGAWCGAALVLARRETRADQPVSSRG